MTSRKPSRSNVYGEGTVYFSETKQRWIGQLNVAPRGAKVDRRERTGKTEREVRLKLKELRREVDEKRVRDRRVTVERWVGDWIDRGAQKPKTKNGYRSLMRVHIGPTIGGVLLADLEWEHVQALDRSMMHLSTTTRRNAHRLLSASLKSALQQGYVQRNAFSQTAPPKADADREAFSPNDVERLLEKIKGRDDEFRWLMALALGARQAECLGLTWDQVDFTPGAETFTLRWQLQRMQWSHGADCGCSRGARAHRCPARHIIKESHVRLRHLQDNLYLLTPKTKSSVRVVPIPAFCLPSLRRLRDEYERERKSKRYVDHGLVFCQIGGAPRSPDFDHDQWELLLNDAGVAQQPLHTARNTAATTLHRSGVPIQVISAILGHSTALMTDHYISHSSEVSRAALNAAYG